MVENRRLLIALAAVLLVGIVVRFALTGFALYRDPYYVGVPDETPGFRTATVYVCPQCKETIYEAVASRAVGEEAEETLAKLRLYYDKLGEDGCCPNHPGQKMTATTEIPIQPRVKFGLPPETEFISRIYVPKDAPPDNLFNRIDLTVVISSKDRRSIHRAEYCLKAQGWIMHSQRPLKIKCQAVPDGVLTVQSIVMHKPILDQRDRPFTLQLVVFYWYAALPDRLTSSMYKRLTTMFYDRLIRGTSYRWSYVLVSKLVPPNGGDPGQVSRELEQFVAEFSKLVKKGRVVE